MSAVATVVLCLVSAGQALAAQADQDQPGDPIWEATGLSEPVFELFTPTSGAFFAQTPGGLQRSDDGGDTWRIVSLPFEPDPNRAPEVAINPRDHTNLFAAGPLGVYRTRDDARSWQLVYPTPKNRVLAIAVSPANPNVVYLGLTGLATPSSQWRFMRSRDGGTTFELVEEAFPSTCGMAVIILQPDQVDPATVYRAAPCFAGRTTSVGMIVSHDQGKTLELSFSASLEYAHRLVGGRGVDPRRFFLASNRDRRAGGSTLFRSDDTARSWSSVLEHRPDVDGPDVLLADVAYDPMLPDRVWIAHAGAAYGVQLSLDGGDTWQDAGGQGLGQPLRLVLGIDGRSLYLATSSGLFRQRLDPATDGAMRDDDGLVMSARG
jgi:photosystem II stability/assembly factor-like uncharacterized protein